MLKLGYKASAEQFGPREFIATVLRSAALASAIFAGLGV